MRGRLKNHPQLGRSREDRALQSPGRHLRFRAADVTEFLRAWGYTVPRELARASARSVVVVGGKEAMSSVTRALDGGVARQIAHPYDALVYAGADPADIIVVDVAGLVADIDVGRMLETLHRACPQSILIALAEDLPGIPSFVTLVARSDVSALRTILQPTQSGAPVSRQAEDGVHSEPATVSPRSP